MQRIFVLASYDVILYENIKENNVTQTNNAFLETSIYQHYI